jgi:hypothetical protein
MNKTRKNALTRVGKWCFLVGVVVGAGLLVIRSWRNVPPVAMLALTLGLFLFGRPEHSASTQSFRLDSPEQVIWLVITLLALAMIIFRI